MKVISYMGIKLIWYKSISNKIFKRLYAFTQYTFIPLYLYTVLTLTFLFLPDSFSQEQSEVFLKGAAVTDIAEEEGFLWVATYGQGIYRYSIADGKWINYSTKSGNLSDDLFYAVEVSKNFVWAASVEGLYTLTKKGGRWDKRKFAQGGEFGNWIRSLKYDEKQNVLWIGRFRNITRFDLKTRKYEDIDRTQGTDQKSNTIKTIELDGDSLIWFGTESGVHIYNKKKKYNDPTAWRYFTNKDKAFKEEGKTVSVSKILFEGRNIWIGTDEFITAEEPDFNLGGLYIHDRRFNWDRIYKRDGLGGNGIYSLCRIGNYIWVGVYEFDKLQKLEYGKGLYLINRITHQVIPVDLNEINITSSSILSFHFDGRYLWIGTGEGLVRLKIDNRLAEWPKKK
jgi:ligand-binding sensor domain-containing protein